MGEIKKMKVSEVAAKLNTNTKRVIEKLAEINITGKTAGSSLDENELKAFFEYTGNKRGLELLDKKDEPAAEKKPEAESASKIQSRVSVAKPTQSTGFVVARRVYKSNSDDSSDSSYSSESDKTSDNKKAKNNNMAGSDLRAGYVTRTSGFDNLVRTNTQKPVAEKKPVAQPEKSAEDKAAEVKAPTATVVRKVRRVVTKPAEALSKENEQAVSAEAEEKVAPVISVSTPAPEKEPEKVQEKVQEKIQEKEPEKEIEKAVEEPAPEKKTEPETAVKQEPAMEKEERDNSVNSGRDFTSRPQRTNQDRPFRENREGNREGNRDFRNGNRDNSGRDFRDNQGNRPQRDGRPEFRRDGAQKDGFQRDGFRKDGYQKDGFQKDGFRKDGYQKDGFRKDENQGGQRQGQGSFQKKSSFDMEAPMIKEEPKRRIADGNFARPTKKEKQETTAQRSTGGNSKDKYQSARQYIGEKKGVSEVYSDDFSLDMENSPYAGKGKRDKKNKNVKQEQAQKPVVSVLTNVKLPETMTVKEFAEAIKKSAAEVIKKMFLMGSMVNQNEVIGFDTAAIIASEFGITAEQEVVISNEEILFDDSDDANDENAVARPPVVVVMGHVDHGKTSLLDAIRSTSVTAVEAGGITQHIGAYTVRINGRLITFLDTPGHEAFTAMRARGAMVTDVAILVVAADDGVKPQTIEAINHAKAAKVSIVVAVNKIDKEGANIEKVRQELAEHEVVCEEWGGDVPFIPVSAKKHQNIETLLETVLLSADILELKANPEKQAKGTIIEAKLDKNKGPVATLLVQRGTLRQGDSIVSGTVFGKIRTMADDRGNNIKKAGPSTPVEITGLPEVPEAGEVFYVVTDEHRAKQLVESRKSSQREKMIKSSSKVSLDDLFNQIQEGKMKELNIIVKADVQGSVEAVKQSLEKLSNEEVRINIIHGGVGAVTESDVTLASVSNAIIIGFNVRPVAGIAEHATNEGVDMRLYRVIYDAIEDIKAAMNGMLEPEFKEVSQGTAEIRQIYKVSGVGSVAGAYVTAGKIVRNSSVRIVRNGIVVFEGKLASLKRFKDDAKEVAQGFECGLSFEKYNDIKEQDVVECYTMEEIKRD